MGDHKFYSVIKLLILILFVLLNFSCHRTSDIKIISYVVQKQDYVNKVNATGILEAVKTYSINCPRIRTNATIVHLVPEGTVVQKGDTVCILSATELENEYKEALKNLETAKAEYNKTIATLHLQYIILQSQVQTIDAQTAIANLDSIQMAFVSDYRRKIINLEMKKAKIEKEKFQFKLKFLKRINGFELKKMEAKIKQEENRVAIEKSKLDKLVLKSNVTGMVLYERLWTSHAKVREGDIVWDRMPIAKIPDMSAMQVKLTVNDTKYKRIEKDHILNIRIDAFPEVHLTGKVRRKPPVGKSIKKGSKIKEFEIYCSIDTIEVELKPGLSVTCDVIIESLKDTLFIPMCAIFKKDSTKIVYKQQDDRYVSQPVELGKNNVSYAIVTAGLREKDVIALSKPPEALIKLQKD